MSLFLAENSCIILTGNNYKIFSLIILLETVTRIKIFFNWKLDKRKTLFFLR